MRLENIEVESYSPGESNGTATVEESLFLKDRDGNTVAVFAKTANGTYDFTLDGVAFTASDVTKLASAGAVIASGTALAAITEPTGGAVVDTEGRAAINDIIAALAEFGIMES